MSHRNLLVLFITVALSYVCYVRGGQNPYARYVGDGFAVIKQGSLEPVPDRELFDAAMRGMVTVLEGRGDEHSQFFPEAEAEPLKAEIRQQFGGIGVRIGLEGDPPQVTVVGPPEPGTPAARANVLPGDHILTIDDEPTVGMSMGDVLSRMRAPDTKVRLTIQHRHEDKPRTIELVREIINIDSILGERRGGDGHWEFTLPDEPRIAHVRIASFGEQTATELARVFKTLVAQGVEGVVLDVRDNAGGSLDAAVAVCQMFLPSGMTIVETRGRNKTLRERYATDSDGVYLDLPIAVLVNQNSASAAEIVAACLQDHGRAIIAGERSYGKGTVQQLVPLESGKSLLKLTWASFWRPTGANIHRMSGAAKDAEWGVLPNAGFERVLDPEQYAAYRKYRNLRDGLGALEEAAEEGEESKAAFVDEQLQDAAKHLKTRLKNAANLHYGFKRR